MSDEEIEAADDREARRTGGTFAAKYLGPRDELSMIELSKAISQGEREPEEAVARLKAATVYPRFLGLDDGGSNVWELANGRWTWADEPHEAERKTRTWTAEDYVIKYGTPTPIRTLDEIRKDNEKL